MSHAPTERHKLINERRSEPRVQSSGSGMLTVISPRSLENLAADVLDVSRWGLQIEVDAFIESGSEIELQLRSIVVSGEVAQSTPTGSGRYRVGIITGHLTELQSDAVSDALDHVPVAETPGRSPAAADPTF